MFIGVYTPIWTVSRSGSQYRSDGGINLVKKSIFGIICACLGIKICLFLSLYIIVCADMNELYNIITMVVISNSLIIY